MSKPKELYLYSPIYDFVAETLISAMEEADGLDICMRVNSPGGNPISTWGVCAKMQERTNSNKIKVDGGAMSSACYMLLFADEVEALDVSTFMLHRAAMYNPSPEDQLYVDKVNADLRAKLEAKVGAAKFKQVTGVSIKSMFEDEERIDVNLTAKQMKELGIVTKITKLNPADITAFNDKMYRVAAATSEQEQVKTPIIKNTMTIEKLKAEHKDVFDAIFNQGVEAEKDRAGAWMTYADVDPEAVKKGIEGGKAISQTQMSEFTRKAISAETLKALEGGNPPAVETEEDKTNGKSVEATKKEKEFSDFQKNLNAKLHIKTVEAGA